MAQNVLDKLHFAPKNDVMSDAASDAAPLSSQSEQRTPNHSLLMRMVVREGKSFKESALAAGYASSVASSGLKRLLRDSGPAAEAYNREMARFSDIQLLKPLAVRRLHAEIVDFNSPLGMKAIEIAGRFKETDWFVRNAEMNIGVFASLGEQAPDATAKVIEAYTDPEK